MSDLTYLFAAFSIIWAGVVIYLIRLAGLRKRLDERLEALEGRLEGEGGADE